MRAALAGPVVREYRELHSHSAHELRCALALGMTPRQFGYRWKRLTAATDPLL